MDSGQVISSAISAFHFLISNQPRLGQRFVQKKVLAKSNGRMMIRPYKGKDYP
jgi:hypothetical protein